MDATVGFLGFAIFWCVGLYALIADTMGLPEIANRLGRIAAGALAFGIAFTVGQCIVFYEISNLY